MTETPSMPQAERTFWQRRMIDPIVAQITQGITPEKMALTLAVGSACALFPILGTTTILCLLMGILLKLNQVAIQVVNFLFWPIHLPMIYLYLRLGQWIFGVHRVRTSLRFMSDLLWDDPKEFFNRFGRAAFHAIVAWALFSIVWSVLVYFLARPVLAEIARRRAAAAAEAGSGEPPEHPVP